MRCDHGTELYRRSQEIAAAVVESGGSDTLEHPVDPGRKPYPSSWILPEAIYYRRRYGAKKMDVDQCMFGSAARKRTTIQVAESASRRLSKEEMLSLLKGDLVEGHVGLPTN